MRFGLSDLEELPSLKEFEALAREALGGDEGVAPAEDYETDGVTGRASGAHKHATAAEAIEHVKSELAAAEAEREHEALATSEGMPSGVLDEDPEPPDAKAAGAGE